MPGHGLGTRSQTESECSKQKLKLELLRGSRPKLESLPVSVVVHEHLVRAGCMFFGTATRRTLTRLHRTKTSTISTFEHSLVLGKNRTFSSTKWENEHYFETFSALTLKIRNFEWKTGICIRSATSESKSTLIMPASHGDISVGLQGWLSAQKRACMLLSIYSYHLMVISCNTFGAATSPNVVDLSTSFNGMNLNMWSCLSSSFGIVLVGFQEH